MGTNKQQYQLYLQEITDRTGVSIDRLDYLCTTTARRWNIPYAEVLSKIYNLVTLGSIDEAGLIDMLQRVKYDRK